MRTYQNPTAHDLFEKVYLGAIGGNGTYFEIQLMYFVAEILYMLVYYPLGWIAAHKRSVKLYGWFSSFSLIGLIFQMILAYANRYNFLNKRVENNILI